MKKKNIKLLRLNKKAISDVSNSVTGGHYSCFPTCTQTALYSRCGNQHCH